MTGVISFQAQVDTDDDFLRIPTPQHPLTLEGVTGLENQPYNGPPFPPVHPPVSVQQAGGVLEADTRQEKALQERAMEWLVYTVAKYKPFNQCNRGDTTVPLVRSQVNLKERVNEI